MRNEQIDQLINYCKQTQSQLKKMLWNELRQRGRKTEWHDGFLYSPGTHPVLLVAHMDTVHKKQVSTVYIDQTATGSPEGDLWAEEGVGGDDRCGIYIVMEILKTLDCHVVFTEDEETGMGGAKKFVASGINPTIDFIVEFDRRNGNDAVFYQCNNDDFVKFVEQFGWKKAWGSCSDISVIAPAFKIAAVNLSSGYSEPHSEYEFIRIAQVDSAVERGIKLVASIGTKFEYVEQTYSHSVTHTDHLRPYSYDWGYDEWIEPAEVNGIKKKKRTKNLVTCQWCGTDIGYQDAISSTAFSNGGKEYFCKECVENDPELAKYIKPADLDDGIEIDKDDDFCAACQSWTSEPEGKIPCENCAIDKEWYRNKKKEERDNWAVSMLDGHSQDSDDDFNWRTGQFRKQAKSRSKQKPRVTNRKRRKPRHRKHYTPK